MLIYVKYLEWKQYWVQMDLTVLFYPSVQKQASAELESAGGASLAASKLAALPGSVPVVNRQGMLWGNCLGLKPNTRHIWQTVYSPCCIFSAKHGACPIFSPNWHIPQPGSWYKCELCGTVHGHTFAHADEIWSATWLLFCAIRTSVSVVMAGSNYTPHIYKSVLLVWRRAMGDRWILDK